MSLDLSTALTVAQTQPVRAPAHAINAAAAKKTAEQFESVFLAQMLGGMFEGISTDAPFGGGEGESMFRSLMVDEYAKQFEKQGGIGLAAPVASQLLKLQESRH